MLAGIGPSPFFKTVDQLRLRFCRICLGNLDHHTKPTHEKSLQEHLYWMGVMIPISLFLSGFVCLEPSIRPGRICSMDFLVFFHGIHNKNRTSTRAL